MGGGECDGRVEHRQPVEVARAVGDRRDHVVVGVRARLTVRLGDLTCVGAVAIADIGDSRRRPAMPDGSGCGLRDLVLSADLG